MTNPHNPHVPRAVIWVAVSSTGQAKQDRISLPEQEQRARAIAAERGWDVIDVLRVPGHSRDYIDIHQCAAAMEKRGITAFTRLMQHWEARDFDWLICYGSDRFARTQTLHSHVVETTILTCGARIFSMQDGEIDRRNLRMFNAMSGYKSASDMDRLRDFAAKDRRKRAELGKAVSPKVPMSHRIVRDPATGKDTGVELIHEMRPLWDDLADLLLQGVGYLSLSAELYKRGHARADGRPYRPNQWFELLRSPAFWGHTALNYRTKEGKIAADITWVWDDSLPPPPGVTVFRDKLPAVYTGEQAARIKAELLRRKAMKGRARPHATKRWTGLVTCAVCGYLMGVVVKYESKQPVRGVRCEHSVHAVYAYEPCPNRGLVPDADIKAFLTAKLTEWLDGVPVAASDTPAQEQDGAWAEREIGKVSARMERLISEQASAPEAAQPLYRSQIALLSGQLANLRDRANTAAAVSLAARADHERQTRALSQLQQGGVDGLWSLPDREINQFLHALLGRLKLAGYRRKVIGIIDPAEFERLPD